MKHCCIGSKPDAFIVELMPIIQQPRRYLIEQRETIAALSRKIRQRRLKGRSSAQRRTIIGFPPWLWFQLMKTIIP
jgi:hypothetical protein